MTTYTQGAPSSRRRRMFQQSRAALWRRVALECWAAGQMEEARRAAGEARRALSVGAAVAGHMTDMQGFAAVV